MTEDHDRASAEAVEYISDFRVNRHDFLTTQVQHANLSHVSFDGQSVHLTFLTWSLPPGATGTSGDNQATVAARIAMPRESAEMLAKLLEDIGIAPPSTEGTVHDDDQN